MQRAVLREGRYGGWREYSAPVDVLTARSLADVLPVLDETAARVEQQGLTAVGYVCYEAAPAFDAALVTAPPGTMPLARFGLFRAGTPLASLPAAKPECMPDWRIDTDRAAYAGNIAAIREQIALGNTYQVNYTIRARSGVIDSPWTFFLRTATDAPYAAFIDDGDNVIVSASPELFFRLDGERIISRPMKGTAARGLNGELDAERRRDLQSSAKDRAENVMVADMIRNDLGRIARVGSVVTEQVCRVEKFATVWQMTTTVRAQTEAPIVELFRALYPCASITGAPKVASMRIIRELEDTARGAYTGAIGYIAPGRRAQFSVAIRTATIDRRHKTAEYGIGGGIVWDSRDDAEYEECLAKAQVLYRAPWPAGFELLETLLWTGMDGYVLLDRHLRRLQASAAYFDFRFRREHVESVLASAVPAEASGKWRVRLLVDHRGQAVATATTIPPRPAARPRVRFAAQPVERNDVFLYHKTSHRKRYRQALDSASDCDDVLLWNRDGEITESSIANVVCRFGSELFTPPVASGLLPGIFREWMLDGKLVTERCIQRSELEQADELLFVNSVRGLYPVQFVGAADRT